MPPSSRRGSTHEQMRAWYRANIDHKREYNRRYRAANRPRLALLAARKRAREIGANGDTTLEQLVARIDYYGGKCWICREAWEQVDHVIPWARGGTNWPANIRPICSSCNYRKSFRDPKRLHEPTRRGSVLVGAGQGGW